MRSKSLTSHHNRGRQRNMSESGASGSTSVGSTGSLRAQSIPRSPRSPPPPHINTSAASSMDSASAPQSPGLQPPASPNDVCYKVVMLGAAKVGKTALVNQFLYDEYRSKYEETVEEMYRAKYEVFSTATNCITVSLHILDTSGAHSFPAMRKLSIEHADGFVLVCSLDSSSSWEEVKQLRQQILDERGQDIESNSLPIVVAANKCDIEEDKRQIDGTLAEMTVCLEWGHGFLQCSAKENENVLGVFKELLVQKHLAEPSSPVVRKSCDMSPTQLKQMKYDTCQMNAAKHAKLKTTKKQDSCNIS